MLIYDFKTKTNREDQQEEGTKMLGAEGDECHDVQPTAEDEQNTQTFTPASHETKERQNANVTNGLGKPNHVADLGNNLAPENMQPEGSPYLEHAYGIEDEHGQLSVEPYDGPQQYFQLSPGAFPDGVCCYFPSGKLHWSDGTPYVGPWPQEYPQPPPGVFPDGVYCHFPSGKMLSADGVVYKPEKSALSDPLPHAGLPSFPQGPPSSNENDAILGQSQSISQAVPSAFPEAPFTPDYSENDGAPEQSQSGGHAAEQNADAVQQAQAEEDESGPNQSVAPQVPAIAISESQAQVTENAGTENENASQPGVVQPIAAAIPQAQAAENLPAQNGNQQVPVIGSLAHAVAVSNAELWVENVYGSKIVVQQEHIAFTDLSAAENAEKQEHYRLMGLVTHEQKREWLQAQLKKLVTKKLVEAQHQSARVLLQAIALKSGDRYVLAVDKWHLEGLPEKPITADDLRGDKRDFQGLNWTDLSGWTSAKVREKRLECYERLDPKKRPKVEQETLRYDKWHRSKVPDSANFMKFRRFDFFKWKEANSISTKPTHRNAVAVTSRNNVFYTRQDGNVVWNDFEQPGTRSKRVLNLLYADGEGNPNDDVNITALAAKHGVLVAGANYGEFGMRSTLCNLTEEKFQITGFIEGARPPAVWRRRGITHIDIIKSHSSDLPQAIISSVDGNIYILDCTTGKLMPGGTKYGNNWISCTSQSPDQRLRVIVGNRHEVIIAEADGQRKVLERLTGHFDAVAACAWSENGVHLATAGYDKLVTIWDARMLTDSNGSSRALTTIASKMSAVRGLEFSPIGSGRRCLMMREEADIVSFLDARTWKEKQSIEVLGQLTGGGWSEDGQKVMIGVQDDLVGGMLTLERCGWGQGDEYALDDAVRPKPSYSDTIKREKRWLDSSRETHNQQRMENTRAATEAVEKYKGFSLDALKKEHARLEGHIEAYKAQNPPPQHPKWEALLKSNADIHTILRNMSLEPRNPIAQAALSNADINPLLALIKVQPPRSFINMQNMECLLCDRQFMTELQVTLHVRTQLHRDNLANENSVNMALIKYPHLRAELEECHQQYLQWRKPQEKEEDELEADAEEIVVQEQYRNRTRTHWRRKAAGAGDFSDLL